MPSKPLKAIKPMFDKNKWRILRGDTVQITSGRHKGQKGKVLAVFRDKRFPRVVVEGCNLIKKHVKQDGAPGFIVSMEAPIHYSNVMVLDPITGVPVRTRWAYDVDAGQKLRVTRGKRASRSVIYPPSPHKTHPGPDTRVGLKDTTLEDVLKVTYDPNADFNAAVAKLPVRLPDDPASLATAAGRRRFGSSTGMAATAAAGALPVGFAASALLARRGGGGGSGGRDCWFGRPWWAAAGAERRIAGVAAAAVAQRAEGSSGEGSQQQQQQQQQQGRREGGV